MKDKINKAKSIIQHGLDMAKKPVVMVSFGKDSMVMLHLIRSIRKDIDIIYITPPQFPKKQEFANKIIEDWNLKVYRDIPPVRVGVMYGEEKVEILNEYAIGEQTIAIPIGRVEPNFSTDEWVCGRDEYLDRHLGYYNYPWDVSFIGHKGSDTDDVLGSVNIDISIKEIPNSSTFVYPLTEWNDTDVWDYIHSNNVPYAEKRYDKDGTEYLDKTYNSDRYPYCNKCFHFNNKNCVECPKTKTVIPSIWNEVNKFDVKKQLEYIK
jgi:3'-phosphoadenosine 5'-phosphosulfate sulfotransferase (PAPS reductase)/FAD synthetase